MSFQLITIALIGIVALGFIGIVGVSLICDKKEEKQKNKLEGEIICPKCGHEFNYKEEDIIRFTFEGKPHREIECPKCKKYIEP